MQKAKTIFCMLLLVLLPGCTSGEKTLEPAILFRADLLNAAGCSFSAQVSADFGDLVYEISMDCVVSDGTTSVTVTSPDTLSGITAHIANETGTVTFDEVALDFGVLQDGNFAPMAAPGIVAQCWQTAYIAAAGEADGSYCVTYEQGYQDEKITVDTWFADQIPQYAELRNGEKCLVKMTISNFQFT